MHVFCACLGFLRQLLRGDCFTAYQNWAAAASASASVASSSLFARRRHTTQPSSLLARDGSSLAMTRSAGAAYVAAQLVGACIGGLLAMPLVPSIIGHPAMSPTASILGALIALEHGFTPTLTGSQLGLIAPCRYPAELALFGPVPRREALILLA